MRKFVSVLLTALMLVSMLVPAVALADDAEAPLVITMVAPFFADEPPKGTTSEGADRNPVLAAIEALCNVKLEITWAPQGDYVSKFSTIMAGENHPMIMVVPSGLTTNSTYLDYCQFGRFWDLTDAIQASDLFREELTSANSLAVSAVGGRSYLFPLIVSSARVGLLYRADWLEKLELAVPSTPEEIMAVAKAFTLDDPDGNGERDTYGFAYIDDADKELTYAGFDTVAVAMGTPNRWGKDAEGQILPYFMFPEYAATLDFFKTMYDEGYMNNDFALIKGNDKHLPLAENKAGMMMTTATNARYPGGKYDSLMDSIVPTASVAIQPILQYDGAPIINSTLGMGGVGGIVISKQSVKDEATLEKILQFFETALSVDGGAKLLALGVEGIHYTETDGIITVSPEQAKLYVDDGSSEVFASTLPRRVQAPSFGAPSTQLREITQMSVDNEPYALADLSMGLLDADTLSVQASIATIISDARVKYIMGQIDAAGFEAAVADWLAQGGQDIIDQINANYAE